MSRLVFLVAVVAMFAAAGCRISPELQVQIDYGPTAGFVTSRMNDLSLIGMDQPCIIAGLEAAGAPLLTDPGTPLTEPEADIVATVLLDCGALAVYIDNVTLFNDWNPDFNDAEQECLRQELVVTATEPFEDLIVAELMGEDGVVRSVTELDSVYSSTFDAIDACGIDL